MGPRLEKWKQSFWWHLKTATSFNIYSETGFLNWIWIGPSSDAELPQMLLASYASDYA